jgi:hypothetical protein
LNAIDPGAKLNLEQIRNEWKNLPNSLKEPYKKKAEEEKIHLGKKENKSEISEEERKKRKHETDKKFKLKVKTLQSKKLEEDELCSKKFDEILESKNKVMRKATELNEKLKVNEGKLNIENALVSEMIKEKEVEIEKLKEKYKMLHKVHKSCSLVKQYHN